MDYRIIIYLVILFILLVLSASFSMLDMAYSSIKISRLNSISKNKRRDELVLKAASSYDETISTILFSNDFVNIFASSLTSVIAISLFSGYEDIEYITTIASIILLFVVLIFCEILPKAIAKKIPYKLVYATVYYFYFFKILFYYLIKVVNLLLSKITSSLFEKTGEEEKVASDEELEEMVDEIEKEGIIDTDQSDLIHNSISFKETSCYEVMTPRVKIFGYDINTPLKSFLQNEDCFNYSRIVVYKKDKDNILGYIPTKTLLRSLINNKVDINSLILPIESVFRTVPISDAMQMMKKSKHHILLVRDEYGGSEGIITMEDILEELIGEIYDEKDDENKELIQTKYDNAFIAKGSLNITDLFDEYNISDDDLSDEYSTVSGFVNHNLGRFAKIGDHFVYQNLYFEVLSVTNYIVDLIYIYKIDEEIEDEIPPRIKKKIEDIKNKIIKKHDKYIEILSFKDK